MAELRIRVCLKSVPDPRRPVESTIDPATGVVRRKADEIGIPRVISPLDACALEEALRLREAHGGEVTVLTMDTRAASEVLRETLALGADRAVLVCDRSLAGADTLATARTLAAAIRSLGPYDLVLCGAWSYHGNTGQVGPQLAELLNIAHISFVSQLRFASPQRVRARSEWEDRFSVMEADLPLLVTVAEGINLPRRTSMMGILLAREKPILHLALAQLGLSAGEVGLAGSPTRVVGVSTLASKRKAQILQGDGGEPACRLIGILGESAVL